MRWPRFLVVCLLAAPLASCERPEPAPTARRTPPPLPEDSGGAMSSSAAEVPHAHPSAARLALDHGGHPGMGDPTRCACLLARSADGWCEHHRIGFVAGLSVPYPQLFETLDPHGHEIGLASITCEECRAAIPRDGRCRSCHIGWHHGLAYMTELTWLLAQGRRGPDAARCPDCRERAESAQWQEPHWCPRCSAGVVGTVFFDKREIFDEASGAIAILRAAISEAERCELCGCAMVYDGSCPDCNIEYLGGRPTDLP